MKGHKHFAPPTNERVVYCQLCGCKSKVKDVILDNRQYSRNKGLIMCKSHYAHLGVNPLDAPFKFPTEKLLTNTRIVSPEPNYTNRVNENDNRVPGKPNNPRTRSNTLNGSIELFWEAPLDQGSSLIVGYEVLYSMDQRLFYNVLVENTGEGIPYYNDTINNPSDYISYQVAAINGFGKGPYSDEFFWPIDEYADILIYGESYVISYDTNTHISELVVSSDGSPIISG